MRVQAAGKSHVGKVREVNQDRFLIKWFAGDAALLAVADGLGGQPFGEVAAGIAIETMAGFRPEQGDHSVELSRLVQKADQEIFLRSREQSDLIGMGTTLTAALISDGMIHWAHVGDSRLYHLRRGRLAQVSQDQTMAQFLVDEGQITLQESQGHPLQNLLEQCLGSDEVEVESGRFELQMGDMLLLCSDGLYTEVPQSKIVQIMALGNSLERRVDSLVKAALAGWGRDNVTVVVGAIFPDMNPHRE